MARPVTGADGKAMGTVRDHYLMLAGLGRTEYAGRVKGPGLPDGLRYLLETYEEISEGRTPGTMGPSRLTWADLAAWQTVSGVALTGWEAETVFAMDAALTKGLTSDTEA